MPKRWTSLFLLTLVLILVAALYAGYRNLAEETSLVSAVQNHLNAIRSGEIEKAYDEGLDPELQKAVSFTEYAKLIELTSLLKEPIDITIKNYELEPPYGAVSVHLVPKTGADEPIVFKLLEKNGQWKIYRIAIDLPENPKNGNFQLEHGIDQEIAQIYQTGTSPAASKEEPYEAGVQTPNEQPEKSSRDQPPEELLSIIGKHLQALKDHNIEDAYSVVSKEFAKATPLESFKTFVANYPILTNYKSASFKDVVIRGDNGQITVILDPQAAAIPVKYDLVRQDNQWKIWNIDVILPSKQIEEDPKVLETVIHGLLNLLRSNEIEKAYSDYTSTVFKTTTPLATFKDFIGRFPVLANFKDAKFIDPKIEKGVGTVTVELKSKLAAIELSFTLSTEDNAWKIWTIQILKSTTSVAPEDNASPLKDAKVNNPRQVTSLETSSKETDANQDLIDQLNSVVQEQLKAFQNNEFKKAYDDFNSEEFKKSTSLEAFQEFVLKFPFLTRPVQVHLQKVVLNGNIPTLSGSLNDDKMEEFHAEYDFISEDGKWKILHIEISRSNEAEKIRSGVSEYKTGAPLEFAKMVIGNKVDDSGLIQDPKTLFKSDSGNIYVNLYILNGKKGTKVELTFRHLDSGANIPPVATSLQEDGKAMISYDFGPPTQGWPKGSYTIFVTAATGQNKEFNLRVE